MRFIRDVVVGVLATWIAAFIAVRRALLWNAVRTHPRAVFAVLIAAVTLATTTPIREAQSPPVPDTSRAPTSHARGPKAACSDTRRGNIGPDLPQWEAGAEISWTYNGQGQPAGYPAAVYVEAVQRAFDAVTSVRNDCGLDATLTITNAYAGQTAAVPNIARSGCARPDGASVIGWTMAADMPRTPGMPPDSPAPLAATCTARNVRGQIVEFDVIANRDAGWSIPEHRRCALDFGFDFQSAMTHEFGHAVGLEHIRDHYSNLTMNVIAEGPCDISRRTLGAGDVFALLTLYQAG